MKKSVYIPYNFDEKYEYRTYKNVGLDYKKAKSRNVMKEVNKKSYRTCDTYSEWKKHVEDIIGKDFTNREDFLRWLYNRKNFSEAELDVVRVVQIPLYIVLISIMAQICDMKNITMGHVIFIIVFLAVISAIALFKAHGKVHFYENIIEIYEKMLKEKQ